MTPADSVVVGLLGEVALRRDGALVPLPGVRARMLLAALAVTPGRSRSAQALIDDVWGEQPPRAPMNALHTQVSRLRAALPEGAVEIGPAGYRLGLTAEQVDLSAVTLLLTQARATHDHTRCLDLVAQARSLWRGEPGADLTAGPLADELATAAADRWAALDALELTAREAIGDLDGALTLARAAASADPVSEPAARTLMRLLATAGHTNEALDVFATLRAALADHLGTDPGPAVAELNTAILRGDFPPPASESAAGHASSASEQLIDPRGDLGAGPSADRQAGPPGGDDPTRPPAAGGPVSVVRGDLTHRQAGDGSVSAVRGEPAWQPVDGGPVSAVRGEPVRWPADDGAVSAVRGEPAQWPDVDRLSSSARREQAQRPSAIGVRAAPNALL
ncbi:AfsR/SARP family transcriptional regulator, partial [Nocardia cyriacigeorgica]